MEKNETEIHIESQNQMLLDFFCWNLMKIVICLAFWIHIKQLRIFISLIVRKNKIVFLFIE